MKLRELADITRGIKVPEERIVLGPVVAGQYFNLLRPSDFEGKAHASISEKELRKISEYTRSLILNYGDYLLYWKESAPKIYRFELLDNHTVPSEEFVVIRSKFSILPDFLGSDENRKYFYSELKHIHGDGISQLSLYKIGSIEIFVDNIHELDDVLAERDRLGIQQPIDPSSLPFPISRKVLPLDKLLKRIKRGELLLDTEFQRRPGLWGSGVKSRLIESMIIRLPIPEFYFEGSNDDCWLVIDGLQRLSTINDFVDGKFVLTELVFLPDLEGLSFERLPRAYQRNIEEYEISAHILQKGTPKSVTYKIFKNINTSALTLVPQEIRHAINPGVPSNFIKEIAECAWFRDIVQISPRLRDRMEDRESVLRFLAFQRKGYLEYKPSMVEFLDMAMTDLYSMPKTQQELYKIDLENILQSLFLMFGKPPFSRSLFGNERKAYLHNNILFELMTYGFSRIPLAKRKDFAMRIEVKESFIAHFSNRPDRFWDYEDAYSAEGLKRRFSEFQSIIISLLK